MQNLNDRTHLNLQPGQMIAQPVQMSQEEIINLEEYLEQKLNPPEVCLVIKLGEAYERRQQFQKAIKLYKHYASQLVERNQILLRLGILYIKLNETFSAQIFWNEFIDSSSNKCQCCVSLSKQLLALSFKYPQAASFALSYALKAIEINSKEKEAWKVFVDALSVVFLINKSLKICLVLLWTFQVCIQTLETDIFEKAKSIYENAFQLQKRFEFVANLGFLCQTLDQQKQAIRYFRVAEKISNKNKELYYFLAVSYYKEKDLKNAKICKKQFSGDEKSQWKQLINQEYWKKQVLMSYRTRQMRFLNGPFKLGKHPDNPINEEQYQMVQHLQDQNQNNLTFKSQAIAGSKFKSKIKKNITQKDKNFIHKTQEDAKQLMSKGPIHIEKEYQYPYSAIGILRGRISKDYQKLSYMEGTAFIIGPNIIMTAAHNIYSPIHRRQCKDLYFTPAGLAKLGQAYAAKTVFFPLEYKNINIELQEIQQSFLSDYALIELDTIDNLQQIYGSLGYHFQEMQNQKGVIQETQLIGFPKKEGQMFSEITQYQGNVLIDTHYLIHKMPTTRGFSGAPVLEKINDSYFVRGIHVKAIDKIIDNGKAALKLDYSKLKVLKKKFIRYLSQYDLSNFIEDNITIKAQDLKLILPAIVKNEQENSRENAAQQSRIMLNFFLHNIGPIGCRYLRAPQLKNLEILNLAGNFIGAEGCRQLALNEWVYLRQLFLQGNDIKAEGCGYLAKANWPELIILLLRLNDIGPEGCKYLAKNKWSKLQKIYLNENNIQSEGCMYLAEGQWRNLRIIWLHKNGISAQGCKYLSAAKWKQLQAIHLDDNNIGSEGSEFLAQGEWNKLRTVYLFQTCVSSLGFLHLSAAKWENLDTIFLQRNNIGDEGCKNLPLSKWKNLRVLYLQMNEIGSQGCRYLLKAQWPKLQNLSLHQNKIGPEGCKYLIHAKWPNLKSLTLYANPIGIEGYECFSSVKWNVYCEYRFQQSQSIEKQNMK